MMPLILIQLKVQFESNYIQSEENLIERSDRRTSPHLANQMWRSCLTSKVIYSVI